MEWNDKFICSKTLYRVEHTQPSDGDRLTKFIILINFVNFEYLLFTVFFIIDSFSKHLFHFIYDFFIHPLFMKYLKLIKLIL